MNSLSFLLTLTSSILASEAALRGSQPAPSQQRALSTDGTGFQGSCTVNNFTDFVGTRAKLESLLGVGSDIDIMQTELTARCTAALDPTIDLSDTIEKGPQFMKNFFDGGTTWNDNYEKDGSYVLAEDAAIIKSKYNSIARNIVFDTPDGGTSVHYPQYFSNFFKGDQECPLGVIECCYTSSRTGALDGNAEMCALDMTNSASSNHIKARSFTVYDTQSSDDTYCSGFAYEKGSFGDSVKYNTLFHMAMMTNLFENGRVKNVPGAPMCGCVSQMPMIDNAACVKPVEGYTIDNTGKINVNLSWEDCGDLKTYYNSLEERTDVEKYFVNSQIVGDGECAAGAKSFLNDQMLVAI